MTLRDNKDYVKVLLCSDYATIFRVGGPPKVYRSGLGTKVFGALGKNQRERKKGESEKGKRSLIVGDYSTLMAIIQHDIYLYSRFPKMGFPNIETTTYYSPHFGDLPEWYP